MRVAVVGATGQVGRYPVAALERGGYEVVRISRSSGVDVYSGTGLVESLAGVDAVIDATNNRSQDEAENIDFFGLLPGPAARIAPTSFEAWLAAGAQ